jgi:para-aminobenzoate synthetase/4-amino-4-deoxychorismate lyase
MIGCHAPFVLLDDARDDGAMARLYENPIVIIETREPGEVRAALARLRAAQTAGLHAAGYLAYEAGLALEPKLASLAVSADAAAPPLLWFGLFAKVREIAGEGIAALLPNPAGAWTRAPEPRITREAYEAALARIADHIAAGDIYQANFTFGAEVPTAGSPLAVYASVRERARAGFGSVVFTGAHWLLSFSPELFFTLEGGKVTTRPMKGTATRRTDPAQDAAAVDSLRADPKQRAENLMIVDLLRNDLSRVARPGSVKVPAMFEVETYPTVHQMTSTVVAELEEGVGAVDLIEAIFPCGSITGAPKIRAMEIIAACEAGPRHAYTGSIGRIDPSGDAAFNVAIRTLTIKKGERRAIMGLGSGIVADSRAGAEWRECLAKGAFVEGQRSFDLIETMRFDPRDGIADLDGHLARMKASATELGFTFNRHDARNELQAATFRLREPARVRLMLSRGGAMAVESRALPRDPEGPVAVAIRSLPVSSEDFRLRHKTSDRAFYDEARRAAGTFEVLFQDEAGFLTEGSFTSLFVRRGGRLITPPLERGLLPGVLRDRLISAGEAVEGDLVAADLVQGFYIGNALRGLIQARLA